MSSKLDEAIESAKEEVKDTKKKKSLADQIRKEYGENTFKSIFDDDPLEVISSGILSLDYVSGVGGLPKGMNVVLQGLPSSGKTEIALDIAKYYLDLDANHKVYFVDVENRLRKDRVIARNIDPKRFFIGRTAVAEKVFDIICKVIPGHEYGLVIVDSIAMLVAAADLEKDVEDQTKPGTQGKALNQGFRKLGATMMDTNSKAIVLFINQLMSNIGAKQWEKKTTAKSGYAPKFLSSFTVEVEQLLGKDRVQVDGTGQRISNEIKLTCEKNSLSKFQNRKAIFELNYDTGPVLSSELINLGMGYGIITKEGNRIYKIKTAKEVTSVSGWDNLVSTLNTNLELASDLKEQIYNKIKNGELTIELDDPSLQED